MEIITTMVKQLLILATMFVILKNNAADNRVGGLLIDADASGVNDKEKIDTSLFDDYIRSLFVIRGTCAARGMRLSNPMTDSEYEQYQGFLSAPYEAAEELAHAFNQDLANVLGISIERIECGITADTFLEIYASIQARSEIS